MNVELVNVDGMEPSRQEKKNVQLVNVHGVDKKHIDELEGKEVDRRFVHGTKIRKA